MIKQRSSKGAAAAAGGVRFRRVQNGELEDDDEYRGTVE